MADILEHPDAQALLAQATLVAADLRRTTAHLTNFLQRYLPWFFRTEHRGHAEIILLGKLAGLERKTTEPIAIDAGLPRRPLQHFVGAGCWDDHAVLGELQRPVGAAIGHPDAVLIVDGCGVPKKGDASCGVARQWCGRLGKVDNCQVGVFLGYAAPRGHALLAGRLFLPADRAADRKHRVKTYVPDEVVYQEKWRLALDLVATAGQTVPHGWVVGDDEFGRVTAFRQQLRLRAERYVLDVPCNTLMRDLEDRLPPQRPGGSDRLRPFERVEQWARRQPKSRWQTITLPGGEKGPRVVKALTVLAQVKDADGQVGGSERMIVYRERGRGQKHGYAVSNARGEDVPLTRLLGARFERHRIEELFAEGNAEVGLDHYEVRSWIGWHHHMTLTMVSLWFLQLERIRLGKKKSGGDRVGRASDHHGVVAATAADATGDSPQGERSVAA